MKTTTMTMKKLTFLAACASLTLGLAVATPAVAQSAAADTGLILNEANSLDELLKNVQNRRVVEARDHRQREQRFQQERANQQQLLRDAEAERTRQEQRSEELETTFEENEARIGQLTEALDKRLGSLRELFGVLQQVRAILAACSRVR